MSKKRVLLLEPFKAIPDSDDPLDQGLLQHFGRILLNNVGVIPDGVYGPPLGLAQLSSILKLHSHDVSHEPFILKAIKRPLKESYIEKKLLGHEFDVAGLSVGDPYSALEAIRYARIIKKINPDIPVVVGGMFPTFFPDKLLNSGAIDYIIRGKGEKAFLDLVDSMNDDVKLNNIRGVCSPGRISPEFSEEIPLRDLPPMDFKGMEIDKYMKKNPFTNFQTSMGCPYNCPFCLHVKFWGLKPRFRSMNNLRAELRVLNDAGCKAGYIVDSAFTLNKNHVDRVKGLLKEIGNEIKFGFETRADQVNDELLDGMKDVGLVLMWLGAESGSIDVLKNLRGKNQGGGKQHLENLRKATMIGKSKGLVVGTSWIIGLPGESESTVDDTISFMKELIALGCDIIDPRSLALFPGTDYHENPSQHGLVIESNAVDAQQFKTKVVACGTEYLSAERVSELLSRVKKEVLGAYGLLEISVPMI
ncbi:MAG: B12-binding domain-containing radical SAM protein [Promethearchaeota archaeon]